MIGQGLREEPLPPLEAVVGADLQDLEAVGLEEVPLLVDRGEALHRLVVVGAVAREEHTPEVAAVMAIGEEEPDLAVRPQNARHLPHARRRAEEVLQVPQAHDAVEAPGWEGEALPLAQDELRAGRGLPRRLQGEVGTALSQTPDFSKAEWMALKNGRVPFRLGSGPIPGVRRVYCRYRNKSGAESYTYSASILYDPRGDADGDGLSNSQDPDDDNDGVTDVDELGKYCSKPFDCDSDDDGLTDAEEVKKGTNPISSDTDRDGLDDQEDPDPLTPLASLQRASDCNQNNCLDICDGVCLLGHLFVGTQPGWPAGTAPRAIRPTSGSSIPTGTERSTSPMSFTRSPSSSWAERRPAWGEGASR